MKLIPRQIRTWQSLLGLLLLSVVAGCGSSGYHRVKPTTINPALESVPEDQLLDVGVAISEARELSDRRLRKQGTNADIRKSECHYIPFHLKNTLQSSSHWGSVQVVPPGAENVDLKINSELRKSNGERMQLKVEAVDASGRVWLERKYQEKAGPQQYEATVQGKHESFQDLYNTIANDLSAFKQTLSPSEIKQIRSTSKLKFAREFAPDAYGDYLAEDDDGRLTIEHLPADDDPLMQRIEKIRERDYMFLETLNQYYEGIYTPMWAAYENWRKYNQIEQAALRQVKREAVAKTVGGVLMIGAAVALQAADMRGLDMLGGVLVLAGGQVVIGGINVSKQAEIHAAAIEELGESFGAEMRPTVIEVEGKQYELTGTANEQYEHWKDLLRRIYLEETGFDADEENFVAAAPEVVSIDP